MSIPLPPGIPQDGKYTSYYAGYEETKTEMLEPDLGDSRRGSTCTRTVVTMKNPMGEAIAADMFATQGWTEMPLPKLVLDGIYAKNFLKPSKIQAAVLPYICYPKCENMVAQAQNGVGKTACFALAMLSIVDTAQAYPQAVVLAPTRELIIQTCDVISQLGQYINVQCRSLLPRPAERNVLSREEPVTAHIVCGTPGKVSDLCKKRFVKFDRVKIFVLDEADVMLNQENQMGPQVAQIRRNFLPTELQVLLFSATFPPKVADFAFKIVPNAHSVQLRKEQLNVRAISHLHRECYNDNAKYSAIKDLFACCNAGQSIIFVNSRKKAFDLAKWLRDDDHAVSLICGTQSDGAEKMDPGMRDTVMNEFRSGVTRVLVATDVLSRGIDVPAVTLVINYELPLDFSSGTNYRNRLGDGETFLHRVGRTGRFGMKGIAITLLTDHEKDIYFQLLGEYKITSEVVPDDLEELERTLRGLR
eukprot:GEMP01024940.1.p1 GENE.GEMP01024940.1~~GEMP01024940.1.p1  ORF type:complete len:473 (+),score=83.43 GEMP01024940.1:122-1540(+)